MAGLLGKAAASNWKRATFGAAITPAASPWQSAPAEQQAAQDKLAASALTTAQRLVARADSSADRPAGSQESSPSPPPPAITRRGTDGSSTALGGGYRASGHMRALQVRGLISVTCLALD